jgi:nascent polypeptide-associated complex subunit alpha
MFQGIDPRMMKQAMKRMGIKQEEILDAKQVIIRCEAREIVIDSPSVQKIDMMGEKSFQISGSVSERPLDNKPDINEDDVKTVMEQANISEEGARKAIEAASGDLAKAIMDLQK